MRPRHLTVVFSLLAFLASLALLAAMSAGGAIPMRAPGTKPMPVGSTAAKVKCPIKASSGSAGQVQWAFTESAPPSGAHPGVRSSYTHGRGQWAGGRASGTVCHADALAAGGGSRNLVLAVSGPAKLTPHTTQLGLLGVALTVKIKVTASDDPSCPAGTTGTVALFASYYSVHRDSLRLRFAPACATHNHLFKGPSLHVLITRKGAQVNSA